MTDLMALTSTNQPATGKSVTSFLDCSTSDRRLTNNPAPSKPTMHVAHPGVCATSIISLPWILNMLMIVTFYMARLVGSPWHTVSAYTGAHAPVWLALAGPEEIAERERAGAAKWGSVVTRWGKESVQRTDVPGWGLVGDGERVEWWQVGFGWLGGWGRKRGARDATREDVEKFVEDGALVWRELERLRREWEERIERS
jgi:3-keto steroid reductase